MRILFTGATGVIGREALPRLLEAGHAVTAAVRPSRHDESLARLGVDVVELDLFDPVAVRQALVGHDTVFHFATAIPPGKSFAKREGWATNDLLRSTVTRHLVDAALAAGVSRFVQEGVAMVYADGGDAWLDESSPVAPVWSVLDSALAAEREVGRFTAAGGAGVVLRLARLYGPGRVSADFLQAVTARRVPLVGDGSSYVSQLHVADAGEAVAASVAVDAGVYNVADEMPVTTSENMELLTDLLGVRPPMRLPSPVARALVGGAANLLAVSHRVSAARFGLAAGWAPEHPSVHTGWAEVVAAEMASSSG